MKNSFGFPQTVLSLSGSSEITFEILKELRKGGLKQCYLAGRSDAFIDKYKKELSGVEIHYINYDCSKYETHEQILSELFEKLTIDMVIYGAGALFSNEECYSDHSKALKMSSVNYLGGMNSLMFVKKFMVKQGFGTIVTISSVAAMLGRVKGYIYSSSKAALDVFTHGMMLELYDSPIQVFLLRPGAVKTKMIESYKNGMKLAISPQKVAEDFVKQLHSKNRIIYSPSYMRYIMYALMISPRRVLAKVKI